MRFMNILIHTIYLNFNTITNTFCSQIKKYKKLTLLLKSGN